MLYIDDKNIEVIKQEIYMGEFMNGDKKGYNINISIEFINIDSNEKGYINLDAGFEKNNDIRFFLNRKYNGKPFDNNDDQFIFVEVYDTEKFLDSEIESPIVIKLKNEKNNKVEAFFEVNDELIKIKYEGYLEINFQTTKETFIG